MWRFATPDIHLENIPLIVLRIYHLFKKDVGFCFILCDTMSYVRRITPGDGELRWWYMAGAKKKEKKERAVGRSDLPRK